MITKALNMEAKIQEECRDRILKNIGETAFKT